MDSQRKSRAVITTVFGVAFLAIGALTVGPLVAADSTVPSWLRLVSESILWFDAGSLALMALAVCLFLATVKVRVRREQKKLAATSCVRAEEPRNNIQVLPAQSSGPDGETR